MMLSEEKWIIEQDKFEVSPVKETLFTLTNGYIGVRGTFEDLFYNETPGTYVAGIFNKLESNVKELVNLPYFWGLRIYIKNEYLNPLNCKILEFKRVLDMKQGILYKKIRLKDSRGRITKIEGFRFISLKRRNLALMRYSITPENYKDRITIESFIDGNTINTSNNPKEKAKHYILENTLALENEIYVEAITRDKKNIVSIISSNDFNDKFFYRNTKNNINFLSE
ncbi:MAG: hypothetical protein B6I29_04000 [Marinitoga sp. 4572_148]|nr:MAG: hypothetical protein B6I29_04000 [Marinitoga sp. 4572_148]